MKQHPEKQKNETSLGPRSTCTLLSWVIPITIIGLTALTLPVLAKDSGDFVGMIVIGFLAVTIFSGSLAGLTLGAAALCRKERMQGLAIPPMIISAIFLVFGGIIWVMSFFG